MRRFLDGADMLLQRSVVFLNGVRRVLEPVQHLDGYCVGGIDSGILKVISGFAVAHYVFPLN